MLSFGTSLRFSQVLWLGSRHNIDRLTVHEVLVPVLSSTVGDVGSARYLRVVIDSRLSMADHVASVCRSAYLRQIRPTLHAVFVMWRCKDISPGVHF